MRDNLHANENGDLLVAVYLFGIGAAMLGLTSVGAISAASTVLLAWFLGRPALVASVSGALGVTGTALGCFNGRYGTILVHLIHQYQAAPLSQLPRIWALAPLDLSGWPILLAPGFVLGALLIVANEDRNTLLRQRTGSASGSKRPVSPWVRLLIKRRLRSDVAPGPFRLGVDAINGRHIILTQEELGKPTVVIGRSGMGKTTTEFSMWEYSIVNRIPLLVIQGKHEKRDACALKALAEAYGRPTYFFDVIEPDQNTFYDPLSNKSVTAKTDCIKSIRNQYSDEHYDFINTNQLQTTFTVLDRLGIKYDLHSLPDFLSSSVLRGLLRHSGIRGSEYQNLAKLIDRMKENEKAGIASLRASIANLVDSSFGHIFNLQLAQQNQSAVLDLLSARQQGAVVYFGLSSLLMRDTSKRLAALIINDLKAALPRMNTPYMIAVDECGSLFDGPQIINVINQGRSYGAMCVLGSQSWADFELPEHPQFVRQLAGSCNTFITHEITDPQDAELAAGIIGTFPATQYTDQMMSGTWTGASSARVVREFRVHPDDLKSLGRGEAYLLSKDRKLSVPRVIVRRSRFQLLQESKEEKERL